MVGLLVFILSDIWTPIPPVMFTIVSILTAILSFFLPETKGLHMPETIAEVESLGREVFVSSSTSFFLVLNLAQYAISN
ncbi:Solute carrier family 22 member 1 [Holothuria leucospilota]|uniref:Solute carrier family 22 member 1 n=1 Tax=Holothuria leucospilota TaxID=206669 RepID=A0A9Q0YCD2_HOLLE|nr:Solute carrier family 22 member 1 [Holothuria leucospilota]